MDEEARKVDAFYRWLGQFRGRALGPLEGFEGGWAAARAEDQAEINALRNRVWAAERATHNHDEMEPEDG